jgi:hypothetical protein
MMVALVRPDSWNLPLFLHVLGAAVLTGAVAATAIAAGTSGGSLLLRRVAFRTVLFLVIPAWILMRVAGEWTNSREDIPGDPGWLGTGYIVGDAGVVVLLLSLIFGWLSVRKPDRGWPARTVTALAALYLAALLVAMFAMSGKPGT